MLTWAKSQTVGKEKKKKSCAVMPRRKPTVSWKRPGSLWQPWPWLKGQSLSITISPLRKHSEHGLWFPHTMGQCVGTKHSTTRRYAPTLSKCLPRSPCQRGRPQYHTRPKEELRLSAPEAVGAENMPEPAQGERNHAGIESRL